MVELCIFGFNAKIQSKKGGVAKKDTGIASIIGVV
jgi:hypothetical protein